MEMSTKANGRETRLTDKGHTFTSQEPLTKENGSKISSMASVLKDGKMAPIIKANIDSVVNMEKANSYGLMDRHSKEILLAMELKEEGSTDGMMAGNTMASGPRTKCMATVPSDGQTEECTEVTML